MCENVLSEYYLSNSSATLRCCSSTWHQTLHSVRNLLPGKIRNPLFSEFPWQTCVRECIVRVLPQQLEVPQQLVRNSKKMYWGTCAAGWLLCCNSQFTCTLYEGVRTISTVRKTYGVLSARLQVRSLGAQLASGGLQGATSVNLNCCRWRGSLNFFLAPMLRLAFS